LSARARTALCFDNGIPVLVTSDADLLDIEEILLRVQFEEADLPPVQIKSTQASGSIWSCSKLLL